MLIIPVSFCFGQDSLKPDILVGIGGSANLINQSGVGFQGGAYAVHAGFFTNKKFYKNLSVFFGLNYSFWWMNDYRNTYFDFDDQVNVHLSTSVSQYHFEVPVILKQTTGKFSYGGGMILSLLISSKLNQNALSNYDSAWMTNSIHFFYRIENKNDNSPFTKVNIAPAILLEYRPFKKISLIYLCSYDLITNPVMQYMFADYNLLHHTLLLTFKF